MSSINASRLILRSYLSKSFIESRRRITCLFLFGSVMLLLIGCRDKMKVPSDVIKQEKMERILLDMIMADRFTAQYVLKDSAKKDVTQEMFRIYSEVFSLHDVTRDEFTRSYKFYMTRPDLTKMMFDTLMQRANRLKEESYRPKMDNPLDTSANRGAKDSLGKMDSTSAAGGTEAVKPAVKDSSKPQN